MAGTRAGDVRTVTIGGREYDPAPETAVTIIESGFTNESAATGNGSAHTTKRRKLGGFDGLTLSVRQDSSDYTALQEISNGDDGVPVAITIANGTTYAGGELQIEGDLNFDAGEGTIEIAMRGPRFEVI